MKEVYDEVRGQWVTATPEELVRQTWLKRMILGLGYPKGLFAVEKELKTLAHLQSTVEHLPDRRADIIFFSPEITPLILIECKAGDLSLKALEQVLGYNTFVKAVYVALVNKRSVLFYDGKSRRACMPSYQELPCILK